MKLLLLVLAITVAPALCKGRQFFGDIFSNAKAKVHQYAPELMYEIGGTLQCDLCEMVIKDIQSVLQGREQEIENFAEGLCNDLPQEYQAECLQLVDQYIPLLLTVIDEMSADEVCQLITMCPSNDVQLPAGFQDTNIRRMMSYIRRNPVMKYMQNKRVSYLQRAIDNDYLCTGCEDVIGCVRNAVQQANETIEEAAQFLSQYCEYCPQPDSCEQFFENLPDLIGELESYLDPEGDCEALGFCPEEEIDVVRPVPLEPAQAIEEEVEEEIEEDEVARVVPPVVRGMRKNKLTKYGATKAKLYAQKYGRRSRQTREINIINNHIDFADNDRVHYRVIDEEPEPSRLPFQDVPKQAKCEICSYFTAAAQGVLVYNHDQVEDGLTELFTDICDALPEDFRTKCTNEVVDQAPDLIIQTLREFLSPQMMCSKIFSICESSTTPSL